MSTDIQLVADVLFAASGEGSPVFPLIVPPDAQVTMVSLMHLGVGYVQGRKKPTTKLKLPSVPAQHGFRPFLCLQRCYYQGVRLRL